MSAIIHLPGSHLLYTKHHCTKEESDMQKLVKKLRKAVRGLTFTLSAMEPGDHFRYFINTKKNEVRIIRDDEGKNTVSRKKSGTGYKALIDLRSRDVKDLVQQSDYLEVIQEKDAVIVRCIRKVQRDSVSLFDIVSNKVVFIGDVIGRETGVIRLAAGAETQARPGCIHTNGRPLSDDAYFSYLESQFTGRSRKEIRKSLPAIYDTVSLFSGAGLLDWAFKSDHRFNLVYGVDFDPDACDTYRYNIGDHIVCGDIRDVDPKTIPDCDLVIGGPCCQAYSNANRTNIDTAAGEAKRLLIDDYIRITKAKQPKVFVIENVPQLLTKEEGRYIRRVFDSLPEYEISTAVVEDDKVGGYTKRKRAIVIGSKVGRIAIPDVYRLSAPTIMKYADGKGKLFHPEDIDFSQSADETSDEKLYEQFREFIAGEPQVNE